MGGEGLLHLGLELNLFKISKGAINESTNDLGKFYEDANAEKDAENKILEKLANEVVE